MKSSILLVVLFGLIHISQSKLSNFEQCPAKITPVDLSKESGQWYQILRSTTYDAGKCYFWDIIVGKTGVAINQTARYMDVPTTQKFNLVQNKNGTYQTNFDSEFEEKKFNFRLYQLYLYF